MMSAALRVFVDAVAKSGDPVAKIDKHLVDGLVADIDATISKQLDKILHSPEVQKLESAWRGLKFLVDRTDFRKNVKIEMLNVSKDTLRESFEDSPELIQSALYRHVYTNAYDQPGADPYSAIVSNYDFGASPQDMALLAAISKVAASARATRTRGSSASARLFSKSSIARRAQRTLDVGSVWTD